METKYIVITGANSGIGLATAIEISKNQKYRVIATCRQGKSIDIPNGNFDLVQLDLSSDSSIQKAAEEIIRISGGRIHTLFNNAGYGLQLAMEDTPTESLRKQLEVNFIGPVSLTNKLLPSLMNVPESKIIFNSSVLGFITIPFRGPYSASKFALEAAADAYRLELEYSNTSVVIVEPGPIKADFKKNALAQLNAHSFEIENSRLSYSSIISRLTEEYSDLAVTSENVARRILNIIESKSPSARYRITNQSKIAFIIRVLPDRIKDFLMKRSEEIIKE